MDYRALPLGLNLFHIHCATFYSRIKRTGGHIIDKAYTLGINLSMLTAVPSHRTCTSQGQGEDLDACCVAAQVTCSAMDLFRVVSHPPSFEHLINNLYLSTLYRKPSIPSQVRAVAQVRYNRHECSISHAARATTSCETPCLSSTVARRYRLLLLLLIQLPRLLELLLMLVPALFSLLQLFNVAPITSLTMCRGLPRIASNVHDQHARQGTNMLQYIHEYRHALTMN